jgi:hypothetical protein
MVVLAPCEAVRPLEVVPPPATVLPPAVLRAEEATAVCCG